MLKNSVSRCGWWSVTESKNIIACHPYPSMTEKEARIARARAWSYIFSCYEKHKTVEAQAARAWQLSKGAGHDELPANFNYVAAGGKDPKEVFEFLFDYCKNYVVKLLIIDSVGLAMVGDAGAYRDVVTFFRTLDRFRTALGCTIVLIDHQANLVGGESYQAKAAFGSSYKGNLSRSRVQVELKEHASGVRRVAVRHNKANFTEYVDPFEVEVRFSQDSIELKALKMSEGDLLEEEQLTSWKRALLLLYNYDEPKTRDDIRTALNIADGTASNVIARLRKDRYAELAGDKIGNEQREVVITQVGKDYVETFLRKYREKKPGGDDKETEDDDEEAPPSSSPTIVGGGDGGACKTKTSVTSTSALFDVVDAIEGANTVALDLETMPPAGWIWEVVAKYRTWRRGLKNKPKIERVRSAWQEFKEKTYKKYAVDPETAQVRSVSVATHNGLNETVDATAVNAMPLLKVLKRKTLVTHNGSFDLGVLRERYGYVHEGKVLDTEILYLLHHYAEDGKRTKVEGGKRRLPDPTATNVKVGNETVKMNSLLNVAKKYLDVSLDKENQSADWSVPSLPQRMVDYSLEDSRILLDLKDMLVDKLDRLGMGRIVDLESRALPAIIHMEGNGFPADKAVAQEMAKRYAQEAEAALKKMTESLPQPKAPDGTEWSWTNPSHVRGALELLGVDLKAADYPKTPNSGEPSTSKAALATITGPPGAVKWVAAYLEYNALRKRSDDFIDKYASLVGSKGTIRGSYTKNVSTGRLSCRRPNLQQVPKRGELQSKEGMRIRDIFRAGSGEVFVVADFEQVELLLAATIAREETMLAIFEDGEDIHVETASWVLGKPKDEVTKEERSLAKALNFGLVYGCSAEKLAESAANNYGVPITLEEAKRYRRTFFEKYPRLAEWHARVEKECNAWQPYTTTPLGRKRKIPVWENSNVPAHTVAKNATVQGAGADAIKLTMAKLFEDRHNCPGNPRLNASVHDEVVLSVAEEHKDAAIEWVKKHKPPPSAKR